MNNPNWNDSLDEMLEKLNNGDFIDQSISEFEKTINQSTKTNNFYSSYGSNGNYRTNQTNRYSNNSSNYRSNYSSKTNSYSTIVPHVNRTIESSNYASRYLHVITCLENIIYDRYPDDKAEGYQACINRYINLIKSNSYNLKPIEQEVDNDLKEYKQRTNGANVEGFLQGYYDALLMVKRCLFNSKLARLQVLSNRLGR